MDHLDAMHTGGQIRRDGNYEIYIMQVDGSAQTRVTETIARNTHATWSPDGTKIAFFRELRRGVGGIYVMNADGSEHTLIRPVDSLLPISGLDW